MTASGVSDEQGTNLRDCRNYFVENLNYKTTCNNLTKTGMKSGSEMESC